MAPTPLLLPLNGGGGRPRDVKDEDGVTGGVVCADRAEVAVPRLLQDLAAAAMRGNRLSRRQRGGSAARDG